MDETVDQRNDMRVHDPVAANQGDGVGAQKSAEHDGLDRLAGVDLSRCSHLGEIGGDLCLERFLVPDEVGLIEEGFTGDQLARQVIGVVPGHSHGPSEAGHELRSQGIWPARSL
ncbi:hypothetical protein [Nigerium massiliense]|uniref:hypothetical protein n=1 Tax=Nigerium massiliense TaxID=1522317 RepID=UPI0012FD61D1|nr:hypothetical protein [Nigerium massiliense]